MRADERDVARDFEAWAALAARLRVSRAQDRRALLADAGLEGRWDAIHEEWSRRLNRDIEAGASERPERYLALCAAEVQRASQAASATLPETDLEGSGDAIPFAPAESFRASTPAVSSSASFAELRAAAAAAPPVVPAPRARAETLPLLEPRAAFFDPPAPSSRSTDHPSSADDSLSVSGRFLADFRASLMPPAPVTRPDRGQEHTALGIDPLLLRASSIKVREMLEQWSSDRLASVLDLAARAASAAEEQQVWQREGVHTAADRDVVRKRFAARLVADSALGFRWPAVVAWLRRS